VRILVDVVSKNGTLLLSIPQRGDGTIDDREVAFLEGMARWMKVNGGAIYGTRPWRVFGEGPTEIPRGRRADAPLPFTQEDIRFTTKDGALFVFVMAPPAKPVTVESLGRAAGLAAPIAAIELVGSDERIVWRQDDTALSIDVPAALPSEDVFAFKVVFE
jgi:alpha-L-fucosidase